MLIGVVVALVGSLAVSDPEPAKRRQTALLIALPALAAVTLAALLSFWAYFAEGAFVVVMFGAVYVRRYGPRWFAFGMATFIAYFFALFLKAHPTQLPWMGVAIALGTAVSYAVRFWLLPEPTHASPRLILAAFFVSPARTPVLARQRSQEFLSVLGALVDECAEQLNAPGS